MKREPELYLISLIHTLGFLKEEVQTYYPNWNFNQGARGFVTYRLDREYELQEIYEKTITFSLVKGILIEKGDKSYIESLIPETQKKYNTHTIHRWDLVEETGEMGDRKTRGPVIDVIRIDSESYALGVRQQVRGDFAPYTGLSPIPREERAPSLAYHKIGEAFKRFRPLVGYEEVFLDIGCSPGGSAYFLLKSGFRVIGVDTAPLSEEVKEDFSEGFLFLNTDFNNLKTKHLRGLPPVNWIVFDVDTASKVALASLLKLMNKLDECVGLIMTVKLELGFDIHDIRELEEMAKENGYSEIRKSILPSHDKEFCLFITKAD
jgi:23S rRNA C2498 (ribose-2'-O)-methylase RlmM